MLYLGGKVGTPEEGIQLAEELLAGGLPLKKFGCMIAAQGGDLGWFESPQWLHQPAYQHPITSPSAGFLASVDCDQVGWAVQRSGAGRTVPGEAVSAHCPAESPPSSEGRYECIPSSPQTWEAKNHSENSLEFSGSSTYAAMRLAATPSRTEYFDLFCLLLILNLLMIPLLVEGRPGMISDHALYFCCR
jgi:hypothetical protein